MAPDKDQALQFAIMLQAGLPASEAIRYFSESQDPKELALMLDKWLHSKAVAAAQVVLLSKPWQEMTLDEQCKTALDYAYAGMAYFLFSRNYSEMGSTDQAKYNAARVALEAKLAGMAGKGDPLSQFLADFVAKQKAGGTPNGGTGSK